MIAILPTIKREQQKRVNYISDPSWYQFRAFPTCPVSTSMTISGGLGHCGKSDFWGGDWWWMAFTAPTKTYDLADSGDMVDMETNFTNVNYYRCFCLLLTIPDQLDNPSASDWKARLVVGDSFEYETPEAAEAALEAAMIAGDMWPDGDADGTHAGIPVCGIILRNDGNVGSGFLPVDKVNRGRSYMWPQDIRPRWLLS